MTEANAQLEVGLSVDTDSGPGRRNQVSPNHNRDISSLGPSSPSNAVTRTGTTQSHQLQNSQYTEFTREKLSDQILSGSLTIVTLFKEIANVIPNAGPLAQILGVTKELILVINEMKDNKEGCEDLVERILKFVKNLADELKRMNVPLYDGTPTAARLYALLL